MSVSKETFKKIEKENISPISKWLFFCKNLIVWIFGIIMVFLGGIAIALTIYRITDNDWDIYTNLKENPVIHFVTVFPYLWIFAVIVFIVFAYYNIRNTKGGYRRATHVIVFASLFGSLLIGTALFSFGIAENIDISIALKTPLYEKMSYNKKKMWTNPGNGLLSGKIIVVNKNSSDFVLKDFSGNTWNIYNNKEVLWSDLVSREIGEEIKIIGEKKVGNIFLANEIRPWKKIHDENERKIFYKRTNK